MDPALIDREIKASPGSSSEGKLLVAVLKSVTKSVKRETQKQNSLLKPLIHGDLVKEVYRAALTGVAANPGLISKAGELDDYVGKLLAGLAESLAAYDIKTTDSKEWIAELVSKSLHVLAQQDDLLGKDADYANKVVKSLLAAGVVATKDGISTDDLFEVITVGLKSAAQNISTQKLGPHIEGIIEGFASALEDDTLRDFVMKGSIKDYLITSLNAVAANPKVWQGFKEQDLVKPVVTNILLGLQEGKIGDFLAGKRLVDTLNLLLKAAAKRGNKILVNNNTLPEQIKKMLISTLSNIENSDLIGSGLDNEAIPRYLESVLLEYLKEPFKFVDQNDWETNIEKLNELATKKMAERFAL